MEHTVRIHTKQKVLEKKVKSGTNLLKFMQKHSLSMSAPCNGNGTCGKCKVKVKGLLEEPSKKERQKLGQKALGDGMRLACYCLVNSDMDVYLDKHSDKANIVIEGKEEQVKLIPWMTKRFIKMQHPDLNDQKSDMDRIVSASECIKVSNSLELLRNIPYDIRQENFHVTMCLMDKKVVAVEAGDTTNRLLGAAFDIGTTTIAAYLVDLRTGRKLDACSMLNPQSKYGSDVISRIRQAGSKETLDEMNQLVMDALNQLIKALSQRNNVQPKDIYMAVAVGNTVMMHLLLKIPPSYIAVSPFIPVTTSAHRFNAKELGLDINPYGYVVIPPAVASYIGSDTIAAILSSGMFKSKDISLLIDIGTNGEIVLGNKKWLLSCSAAAGPAFEGAHIGNGVAGIYGAIDKVCYREDLEVHTIGDEKPVGICGTGLVDAVAVMIQKGVLNESGRMLKKEEAEHLPQNLRDRLCIKDESTSFLLVEESLTSNQNDITISQRDVRELQNAKAAIMAGIQLLVKHAGIGMGDIKKVYLAGGFGSFISVDSAVQIGLIPEMLKARVEPIGNAAGSGALGILLSQKCFRRAQEIKNKVQYLELSALPDFEEQYIKSMSFGKL